jgi:hypothetical protein
MHRTQFIEKKKKNPAFNWAPGIQRSGIAASADDPANLGAGDIWARAGPYQVEVRACPLRQVQKTRGGVGVLPYPTAPSSVPRFRARKM